MKHASLAAHYRPQTFAEVAGQDMITTVLSRAAAQDQVAAAYLLSGTRGVGKTTIARILAKALNCKNAPTAEPCNECANCQMITKGNHVDVIEIDGASNNGVDDARALRENIGYAAMEGRYKVFIIDEAHMLTRAAFNALLKTLEEPPARVVFIFATTEVHKFPITIVSRCQHFIFKRLSEDGLVAHLSRVLAKEDVNFDPQAVRTIAKRAAGSVRDGMSLLGQTLALSGDRLDMESTRNVLGLAGQELFIALMQAVVKQDCPAVIALMQKLCDQGIDMGFFLRELVALWRTLFLLREAGEGILASLELSQEEATLWGAVSAKFSAAHLHAAWHMTLDAMRKVIHSPEPAAALELLLLNITLMPRLLPLQNLEASDTPMLSQAPKNMNMAAPTTTTAATAATHASAPVKTFEQHARQYERQSSERSAAPENYENEAEPEPYRSEPEFMPEPVYESGPPVYESGPPDYADYENAYDSVYEPANEPAPRVQVEPTQDTASEDMIAQPADANHGMSAMPAEAQKPVENASTQSFESIMAHMAQKKIVPSYMLSQVKGSFDQNILCMQIDKQIVYDKISAELAAIQRAVNELCQSTVQIQLEQPKVAYRSQSELIEEFSAREEIQLCMKALNARLYDVLLPTENKE